MEVRKTFFGKQFVMQTMKHLCICLIIFLCVSCIEKPFYYYHEEPSCDIECKARNVANDAMNKFYNKTKASIEYNESPDVMPFLNDDGDTLGVSVNYGPGNGFVYLSRDCNSVLVISDNSDFETSIEIPAFNRMINDVSSQYQFPLIDPTPVPVTRVDRDTVVTTVSPMVRVGWHQRSPFNLLALNDSNKVAGCTPIAIAQVMSYYRYPESIPLTFQGASEPTLFLDWDTMISNTGYHGEYCLECMQKAKLLRQIAEICDADYKPSATGAWPYVEYLNILGYTGTEYNDFIINPIISSLDNSNPCIISGFNSSNGHTWVIDGYKREKFTEVTYEYHGLNLIETNRFERINTYFHFNLGWGNANLSVFCLSDVYEYVQGPLVYGGSSESHPVTIFSDPNYTDVRLLVTGVKPINQ